MCLHVNRTLNFIHWNKSVCGHTYPTLLSFLFYIEAIVSLEQRCKKYLLVTNFSHSLFGVLLFLQEIGEFN